MTSELTAELRNWLSPDKLRLLNREWVKQGRGYNDIVIETLCTLLQEKKLHYENILGYLQTRYNQIDRGFREQFYNLYLWFTEIVYWLLYFRHVLNNIYFTSSLPFYKGLKVLASKEAPLWVFSLNHDLTIELISEAFDIPLKSGFSSKLIILPQRDTSGNKIGQLEFDYLSREDINTSNFYYLKDGECGINLMKIHGALDVFGYKDELNYLKLRPLNKGITGWLSALRSVNENLIYPHNNKPVKVTNEIAYMDGKGEMQFLRRTLLAGAYKFDKRINQNAPPELLDFFEHKLNYFQELITIGYGFGDSHINRIIANWLEFTEERKLRVVAHNHSFAMPQTLMHISPQIKIYYNNTTSFLDHASSINRSLSESLYKNVRNSFRKFQLKKRRY